MKRNYVPDALIHRRSDIANQNAYLDKFCTEFAPVARKVYAAALSKRTSEESAEVLIDEARTTLNALLSDEVSEQDVEAKELTTQLEAALKHDSTELPALDYQSLIERGAEDLARALVGFWFDLGKDELERYKRTVVVSIDLMTKRQSEAGRELGAICSRFGLDALGAYRLLSVLNAGAFAQEVANTFEPSKRPEVILVDIAMPDLADRVTLRSEPYTSVHTAQLWAHASPSVARALTLVEEIDRFHMNNQRKYVQSAKLSKKVARIAQTVNRNSAHSTIRSVTPIFSGAGFDLEFNKG